MEHIRFFPGHLTRAWSLSNQAWELQLQLQARETAKNGKGNGKVGLGIRLAAGFGVLICGIGTLWYIFRRKRASEEITDEEEYDVSIDDEFEKGTGPKRFTYHELRLATNDFAEEGKLGEGGFGGVYRGGIQEDF